jgi:hypothetical protein
LSGRVLNAWVTSRKGLMTVRIFRRKWAQARGVVSLERETGLSGRVQNSSPALLFQEKGAWVTSKKGL